MGLGYNPWDDDKNFLASYDASKTLIDRHRMWVLYSLARSLRFKSGSVAEVGVYKGGSLKMLNKIFENDLVLGFDTFTGMPDQCDPERGDDHRPGDFSDTSIEAVRAHLDDATVQLFPGVFPQSAYKFTAHMPKEFKFVHVDCDIYKSVFDCCMFFYPRLVDGGVMVFDDYGFDSCRGAFEAVNEVFPRQVVYIPTGQALVIK